MRSVPDSMDSAVVAEIDARLAVVAATGVTVLWAIESGSRAWGFPSPDSDYDCRFVYARPEADYLSLRSHRDVIETPLDHVFDVNGWDLAKALRLLVKGNAVITEWLRSPIVYRGDAAFRDELLALADTIVDRTLLARHYLHVGQRQLEGDVLLPKRFLYALRSATTLCWLRDHPELTVPPMDLPTLLRESSVSDEVQDAAALLIETKAVSRDLEAGAVPEMLTRFVADEFDLAATTADGPHSDRESAWDAADEFFRTHIR